jgi:hypothetical protein
MQKSSESGTSNSPNGGTNNHSNGLGRTLAKALGRLETPAEILQRRRQRLSTISSDFFDENADSPRLMGKQRRKSSNFDMLCDPFKYQDYVQKFLDGIEEEENYTTTSRP